MAGHIHNNILLHLDNPLYIVHRYSSEADTLKAGIVDDNTKSITPYLPSYFLDSVWIWIILDVCL